VVLNRERGDKNGTTQSSYNWLWQYFFMHTRPISQRADVSLVAICDIKEARAKAKASQFQCAFYTDYLELFNREALDVVHICLPHYLPAQWL